MKRNKVALFAAVALSAAGLAFSSVSAADSSTTVATTGGDKAPCADGKCDAGRSKGGFFKELGITDDQLEKMSALKKDFANSIGPKKAELMSLHRELRDEMTKPGISKSQLLTLQAKINAVRDELSTSKVSYMADRIAVLTDDQKAKIRSFALKRELAPGGGHHFKGGHFRGGKGQFHGRGGDGGRSFGGDKPAASAPETPNQV